MTQETNFWVEDKRRGRWSRPSSDSAAELLNPYKTKSRARAAAKRLAKDHTWDDMSGNVRGVRIVMERVTRVERIVEVVA